MPTAYVHLPTHVEDRRRAFINGFSRLGFIVCQGQPCVPLTTMDVSVIWNQTARSTQTLQMAQKGGGCVIVAENGYVGADQNGAQAYALAVGGHNGAGHWYAGDESRLDALAIEFQPMRRAGTKVLVADQRGIGSPLMRSPPNFGESMAGELRANGFYASVRPHPGRSPPERALAEDLAHHDAVVVWSSNVATQALIAGLPTYYAAPSIVSAGAAVRIAQHHPQLATPCDETTRRRAFQRLAWAQWFLAEIESGEALRTLIDVHNGRLPSAATGLGL